MTQVQTKTKKWGSSIGVILPKALVEEIGIKENQIITLEVKKTHKAKEFFGMFKEWNKTEQQIKDEAKKGW